MRVACVNVACVSICDILSQGVLCLARKPKILVSFCPLPPPRMQDGAPRSMRLSLSPLSDLGAVEEDLQVAGLPSFSEQVAVVLLLYSPYEW